MSGPARGGSRRERFYDLPRPGHRRVPDVPLFRQGRAGGDVHHVRAIEARSRDQRRSGGVLRPRAKQAGAAKDPKTKERRMSLDTEIPLRPFACERYRPRSRPERPDTQCRICGWSRTHHAFPASDTPVEPCMQYRAAEIPETGYTRCFYCGNMRGAHETYGSGDTNAQFYRSREIRQRRPGNDRSRKH